MMGNTESVHLGFNSQFIVIHELNQVFMHMAQDG